jgi:hypothetical protein
VPWFRLDDSFHSHPKVIAAGNEAIGLYARCGTYAAQFSTDGFIPEDIAVLYGASDTGSRRNPGTGKPETLAETLVRAKLWRRARGGWRMPDYLEYNPSKEAVDNERKKAAERQRRRREALLSRRDSRGDSQDPVPSRPVPDVNGSVSGPVTGGNARASPDDGIVRMIMDEIHAATGRRISPEWATRTYHLLLSGRSVDRPVSYIRSAIRNEPDPKKRFLPLYPEGPP